MGSNESLSGLLEGHIRIEFAEVVEGINGVSLVNLESGELGEPGVLQGLLSRRSVLGLECEKGADEALGFVGDRLPHYLIEFESTLFHFSHDILI